MERHWWRGCQVTRTFCATRHMELRAQGKRIDHVCITKSICSRCHTAPGLLCTQQISIFSTLNFANMYLNPSSPRCLAKYLPISWNNFWFQSTCFCRQVSILAAKEKTFSLLRTINPWLYLFHAFTGRTLLFGPTTLHGWAVLQICHFISAGKFC